MKREMRVLCNPIFGAEAYLNKERQDPVFFEGISEQVLDISYGEYVVHIYCDGDTRARYSTDIGREVEDLRSTEDFIGVGLDTDKKLYDASEDNMLEWVDNPWFDMYGCTLEHLDCVTHSIDEAIASAKEYLLERAESADIIMGVNDYLTLGA